MFTFWGPKMNSNIASNDIDDATAQKLRGDAIGDTMYSEVFVVKTLMQFSDLQWNEEAENDLCFLWDMTEEKDVCRYLFQVSYPSLACSAIRSYDEPRFIEIVVGIFANLLCSKCEKNVAVEEVEVVLNLLNSQDPYILIQVMRFVHAVSFMFDRAPFVTAEHLERCTFIMENSTNNELLATSLKAMACLTEDLRLNDGVIKADLLTSAITAVLACKEEGLGCEVFDVDGHQTNMKHVMKVGCNLCAYIEHFGLRDVADELKPKLALFLPEINLLLQYYSVENNLLPVDDLFTFYVEALTYICKVLRLDYVSEIAVPMCNILAILTTNNNEDVFKGCAELLSYFVSLKSSQCVEDMKKHQKILQLIELRNFEFDFSYDLKSCLDQ